MATSVDRNKDFPGLDGTESGSVGTSRGTILLSDIPDIVTLTGAEPIAPVLEDSGLGSAALIALGQRYDILCEAGRGAMGSVYKARDRETQQIVALKLVRSDLANDQTMIERFKSELLFARKITHKSVCRVFEFNRAGGIAYTSMEFVEGESLRAVLKRFGGLPLRKALDLTLQVCSGLKEAHAQGIVHRDLKPENLMIDAKGNVKIMDFGIARSMESAARLTGAMMGTPAYMAPEQVSGKPVDYRTDVYSLGLVLYEVFTGKPAFVAENPVALALKQVQETPAPPHEIEPTVPVSIERAILKCLEKEPLKRFQSVAELEKALTSSGARAVLAGPSDPSSTLANREAVAQPASVSTSSRRAAAASKRILPLIWILLGACIVIAAASGMHWMAVSAAAKNQPQPARLAAPVPPEFALEKQEARPQPKPRVRPEASPMSGQGQSVSQTAATSAGSEPAAGAPISSLPVQTAQEAATLDAANRLQRYGALNRSATVASLAATGATYLWIGRFQLEDRAREAAKRIEDLGLPTAVVPRRNPNGEFFVVLSGPFAMKKASDAKHQLEDAGFTNIYSINDLILDHRLSP